MVMVVWKRLVLSFEWKSKEVIIDSESCDIIMTNWHLKWNKTDGSLVCYGVF